MKKIATSNLPEKCWIFSENRYILFGKKFPVLPCVNLELEGILKVNGIPYRKTLRESHSFFFSEPKEVCEYWDSKVYFEETLILPLYERMPDGSYKYCEKNYSQNVLTVKTIEAAQEIEKFVEEEIENYEEILYEVQLYKYVKEKLADNAAVVTYSTVTPKISIYEINMNYDNFKILRPLNRHYIPDLIAIFDMNKIAPDGYETLQVPKRMVDLVIGRGGENIQAWEREIGVKKILVIPV